MEQRRSAGDRVLPSCLSWQRPLGGWHPDAKREVKKLGAALARHTGQEEGEAVSHLWSRLSILLQRGNAAILGNRNPAIPRAHIDGVI